MTEPTVTAAAHPPVFACDLQVLDAAERRAYAALTDDLWAHAREVHPLPNGLRAELDGGGDTLQLAARWIALEQRCCPFWRFELSYEAGALTLSLEGPEGAGELLRSISSELAQR